MESCISTGCTPIFKKCHKWWEWFNWDIILNNCIDNSIYMLCLPLCKRCIGWNLVQSNSYIEHCIACIRKPLENIDMIQIDYLSNFFYFNFFILNLKKKNTNLYRIQENNLRHISCFERHTAISSSNMPMIRLFIFNKINKESHIKYTGYFFHKYCWDTN